MELNQVYYCQVCSNLVELTQVGGGDLVCCGQNMTLLTAKTIEEGKEKHLPIVEASSAGITVTVSSTLHPMDDKHHIVWIEALTTDDKVYRHHLKPTHPPHTRFSLSEANIKQVRIYCNIHGLWADRP